MDADALFLCMKKYEKKFMTRLLAFFQQNAMLWMQNNGSRKQWQRLAKSVLSCIWNSRRRLHGSIMKAWIRRIFVISYEKK